MWNSFATTASEKETIQRAPCLRVTKAFNLCVGGDSANNVILCEACDREAQPPIDVGALPKCIRLLPQRSRIFLSPFRIDTNLGRTTGYNLSATPHLYRTLTGRIPTEHEIHVPSPSILESSGHGLKV